MFDYKKRSNSIEMGYRLNESYWNQGIASRAAALMCDYLLDEQGLSVIHAYVMPQNIYSEKVLIKNGFTKLPETVEQKNWGREEMVITDHFVLEAIKRSK